MKLARPFNEPTWFAQAHFADGAVGGEWFDTEAAARRRVADWIADPAGTVLRASVAQLRWVLR